MVRMRDVGLAQQKMLGLRKAAEKRRKDDSLKIEVDDEDLTV